MTFVQMTLMSSSFLTSYQYDCLELTVRISNRLGVSLCRDDDYESRWGQYWGGIVLRL